MAGCRRGTLRIGWALYYNGEHVNDDNPANTCGGTSCSFGTISIHGCLQKGTWQVTVYGESPGGLDTPVVIIHGTC